MPALCSMLLQSLNDRNYTGIIGAGLVHVQLILVNLFRQWHFRNVPPMRDKMQRSCACTGNYDTEGGTVSVFGVILQ